MKKKLVVCILCLSCVGFRVIHAKKVGDPRNLHPLVHIALYPGLIAM